MNVFCGDCEYLKGYSEKLGAPFARCNAPAIVKQRKKEVGIYPTDPHVLNLENDCRYYKPKEIK